MYKRYRCLFIALGFAAVLPGNANALQSVICANVADASQRLECYDQQSEQRLEKQAAGESNVALRDRIKNEEKLSVVGDFIILPHRPTYFMPFSYMRETHNEPFRAVYGDQADEIQNAEAKFQLSFKVPLWLDIGDRNMSLWFAYTQVSLWQIYNAQVSSPFRETNYEPELALAIDTDFKLLGMDNTFILLGINHQSNGQTEPLSRSWNRLYATFVLERKKFMAYFKPWYRLPEDADNDDNPDIDRYLGYSEFSLFYKSEKRITGLRLWNNLRAHNNRTSVQLDWTFPLKSGFKGYVQYFNGYGETLIDYNYRTKRIGLGVMLNDWF